MGGIKGRKSAKRLAARIAAYAAQASLPGFKRPGSNKKRG
jgi:hypothetical protein